MLFSEINAQMERVYKADQAFREAVERKRSDSSFFDHGKAIGTIVALAAEAYTGLTTPTG